eukprot:GGOE01049348.1.p1 GENE.GGOE01049348.1~~GGOE01049348.1.p1  ORF type:complete len:186 (+),score=44.25 GGOE01049348.1:63-560(+)
MKDDLVYGSERPGYSKDNERVGAVTAAEVVPWCQFMKAQGIHHILSLLGDDEVQWYQEPIEETLTKNGFQTENYSRTSVFAANAAQVCLDAFKRADAAGEKIVVHCSGGSGRGSLGLGLWLMHKYSMSAEEAVAAIQDAAVQDGTSRRPDASKLQNLMAKGTLKK